MTHFTDKELSADGHFNHSLAARRGSSRTRLLALAFLAATTLLILAATTAPLAHAAITRPHDGALASGAFPPSGEQGLSPGALAVDQSNGDIYAIDRINHQFFRVLRFDSTGAPKNFTAGPDAGTNALTGLAEFAVASEVQVAIDNSSGPLAGTVYVTTGAVNGGPGNSNNSEVRAFATTGAPRGSLDGSGSSAGGFANPTGVAVDPSDGSVYIANRYALSESEEGGTPTTLWRYQPVSPLGSLDDSDFAITGVRGSPRSIAAVAGAVYGAGQEGTLRRYSASSFASPPTPNAPSTQIGATGAFRSVATDPATGDVYGLESSRGRVSVFDSSGQLSYRFGAAAYFSTNSIGIAAHSAPAAAVYVSDPQANEIDAFGLPENAPVVQHPELHRFGPDGTVATEFSPGTPGALAFDSSTSRLYALDDGNHPASPGSIYGFDSSSPPAYPPLAAFSPLSTVAQGFSPGLAVNPTTGNLYFTSSESNLIYGFDSSGAPLGGAFPIDPATTAGPPAGSPKFLCGAAVSSSGEIFVSNYSTKRILRYSSAGAFLGLIDTSAQAGTEGPCELAFAPNGDLYVALGNKGVWRYTAASSYASATLVDQRFSPMGLVIDPSNNHLYVTHGRYVDEWDESGNLVSEFFPDDFFNGGGAAVDPATGHLFLGDVENGRRKVRVFAGNTIFPEATAKPADQLANTSATLHGAVSGQNLALTDCRFEYVTDLVFQNTGFTDLSSGGQADCDPDAGSIPADLDPHDVAADISGLELNTTFRFRVVAANATGSTPSDSLSFTTTAPPEVETTGTPLRSDTTATLLGRVYPVRATTTYHFEWGTQGPCDANPCTSTPDRSAGSGDEVKFVAEEISGLTPGTPYHYRLVADNGNADGPSLGEDMTITTKAAPDPVLDHGSYPGPPGSDRAYELVSLGDSSGNPAEATGAEGGARPVSPDGERAYFRVSGGSPIAEAGNAFSTYVAQRPPGVHPTSGWQSTTLSPPRDQQLSQVLGSFVSKGSADLSHFYYVDTDPTVGGGGHWAFWRLDADGTRTLLFDAAPPRSISTNTGGQDIVTARDGTRIVAGALGGSLDPAFPAAAVKDNLYDISAGGTPQLVSFLPGETVPACGSLHPLETSSGGTFHNAQLSPDGEHLLFASQGDGPCDDPPVLDAEGVRLYLRDLSAGSTVALPDAPLSGPDCHPDILTKATPGAFFFTTVSRVTADDVTPESCGSSTSRDVYRYDITGESIDCLTCPGPLQPSGFGQANIADDGSRLYFTSGRRLLPGVPAGGGIYRVEVASGAFAFVAPFSGGIESDAAINDDGSSLYFRSSGSGVDALGPDATTNANTEQVYRYDDEDRSLVCVSCPLDGSAPLGNASRPAKPSDDGIGAFATPTPLLAADHNTNPAQLFRGIDAYEWRDGRLLLVTDGTSSWSEAGPPSAGALSASGRDLIFTASARFTSDAADDVSRVYDARIGGGIDLPPPGLPPCDLNSGACEGASSAAADIPGAGSAVFEGQSNRGRDRTPKANGCPKGKRKVRRKGKARCVKPPAKKTSNHRRSAR